MEQDVLCNSLAILWPFLDPQYKTHAFPDPSAAHYEGLDGV